MPISDQTVYVIGHPEGHTTVRTTSIQHWLDTLASGHGYTETEALVKMKAARTIAARYEAARAAEDEGGDDEGTGCTGYEPAPLKHVEVVLRRFLIERARNASPASPNAAKLTYGTAAAAVRQHVPGAFPGARFTGIGEALGNISRWETAHGRPLLSVLCVYAGLNYQGSGFTGMARAAGHTIPDGGERAFAKAELLRVIDYWTTHIDLDGDEPVATTDCEPAVVALPAHWRGIAAQLDPLKDAGLVAGLKYAADELEKALPTL